MIAGKPSVIRGVADVWLMRYMQVGDHHHFELFLGHVLHHAAEVGKGFLVDGEGPVFVLEINVQPEYVRWDAILAQPLRDLA
jgi:hypothetical protein